MDFPTRETPSPLNCGEKVIGIECRIVHSISSIYGWRLYTASYYLNGQTL